jgi:hypothetical protein
MRRFTNDGAQGNPDCFEAIWATKQPGEV